MYKWTNIYIQFIFFNCRTSCLKMIFKDNLHCVVLQLVVQLAFLLLAALQLKSNQLKVFIDSWFVTFCPGDSVIDMITEKHLCLARFMNLLLEQNDEDFLICWHS